MDGDERGFRIALVAPGFVNPEPGGVDAVAVLAAAGWGVIALPAAWYPDDVAAPLLEQVAEEVDEFTRHGYDVIRIGDRAGLTAALAVLGIAPPDAVDPEDEAALHAFLASRPDPRPTGTPR
jgi:hypothetical protein